MNWWWLVAWKIRRLGKCRWKDWDIREEEKRKGRSSRRKKAVRFIYRNTDARWNSRGKAIHSLQTFLTHIWSTCLGQYIIVHVQIPKACQVCESCQGESMASCLCNRSDDQNLNISFKHSGPFWSNTLTNRGMGQQDDLFILRLHSFFVWRHLSAHFS